MVKCCEMGGFKIMCSVRSAENFEKVTVKGGEIGDFFLSEIGEFVKFLFARSAENFEKNDHKVGKL